MGTSQQFSLRWNNYLRHITTAFDSLRSDEDLVDVTLSCEGKRIRAHKMLLSACSTYFRDLFKENPCQHPVIIFRNVKFEDLAALVDFMYQGEVNVIQDQLASFLTTAELLAVQGLSDGSGKDQGNEQPKEVEIPDSPVMPAEPEVQLSNNTLSQKQLSASGSASVSSPISFFPMDQNTESPPSKRRKWGSGVKSGSSSISGSQIVEKDSERDRETERRRVSAPPAATVAQGQSSPDPVEIIPVVPNLKLEMPDYMEQEQDASSCSYSDSNQGAGGGQGSSRDTLSQMSQMLPHGASASIETKQDSSELYSANSGDASMPPSEGLSASEISQILAKPGTSGENQSQDSLQGAVFVGEHWMTEPNFELTTSHSQSQSQSTRYDYQGGTYTCKVCGKSFRRQNSCYDHMAIHLGTTRCTVCDVVLSRKGNMKRHMRLKHGIVPENTRVKSEEVPRGIVAVSEETRINLELIPKSIVPEEIRIQIDGIPVDK